MRFIGILIVLGCLGRVVLPELGVDIEDVEAVPIWAAIMGSLAGGFLLGFGRLTSQPADAGTATGPAESDLQEPEATTLCCSNPACGAVVRFGQRFCTTCGTPLKDEDISVVAKESVPRCPNNECNAIVRVGQNFCTACGAGLK